MDGHNTFLDGYFNPYKQGISLSIINQMLDDIDRQKVEVSKQIDDFKVIDFAEEKKIRRG